MNCAIAALLSGCGLTTPDMQQFPEPEAQEKLDEANLVGQVKCEIRVGVQDAIDAYGTPDPQYGGKKIDWLENALAKVTLSLQVDDKSALTPGLTVGHPFQNAVSYFKYGGNVTSPQSYSTVFGLQASADATRQEQIAYTYNIRKLINSMPMPQDRSCSHISNVFIYSDLKIRDFIVNKVYLSYVPGLVYGKGVPFSTFSDTITFVVMLGGSVTPIWKFVNITGSSNTPFVNAVQTRSDFVTVTISQPGTTLPGPQPQLSPEGEAINNAQLIGQAVSNAIRSQLLPAQ